MQTLICEMKFIYNEENSKSVLKSLVICEFTGAKYLAYFHSIITIHKVTHTQLIYIALHILTHINCLAIHWATPKILY